MLETDTYCVYSEVFLSDNAVWLWILFPAFMRLCALLGLGVLT
jgi:hypothetical protein